MPIRVSTGIALRRLSAAYVFLGTIAILFCFSRESCGAKIRYSDPTETKDFNVNASSPDGLKDLLRLLTTVYDYSVTTTGARIRANLDTSHLKQIVGFAQLPVTPSQLAQAAGFFTFGWVQTIERIPASWSYSEVNGSAKTPISTPILDPIKNYAEGAHYYEVHNSSLDSTVRVRISEEIGIPIGGDGHEPYWDFDYAFLQGNDPFGNYYRFSDRPTRPDGWFANGESMEFRTKLVGVDANNDVVQTWDRIGTNFTWKTNAVTAEVTSFFEGVDEGENEPTIIRGAIFDVAQDFPIPELNGDFDQNGVVDGADFLLWQQSFGSDGTNLPADADGNGKVDGDDLTTWKDNFKGSVAAAMATPEPATVMPLAIAFLWAAASHRSNRKSHRLTV